jgi:hypothetical protein
VAKPCWRSERDAILNDSFDREPAAPTPLFNGADPAGWQVIQGDATWHVVDGVLRNAATGGNLVTARRFDTDSAQRTHATRSSHGHSDKPHGDARGLV